MKYVCKQCGSEDIQVRMWVGANDNKVGDWCNEDFDNECWCNECEDITSYETKEDEED